MDPRKRPAAAGIVDDREGVLFAGRFGTDRDGYKVMLAAGRKVKDRAWAAEGCDGTGRRVAPRLVAGGRPAVGVPAELSARARVFCAGQARSARSMPVGWPSPGCTARTWPSSRLMMRWWRCGCWPVAATNPGRPVTGDQPAAPSAAGVASARGEEVPVRRASQATAGHHPPARHRRQDPPPARRRADHRAHPGRQAHQDRRRRTQTAGDRDRQQPAHPARHRTLRRRTAARRRR